MGILRGIGFLGVSLVERERVEEPSPVKALSLVYCRKLLQVGLPWVDAKVVALAIAGFDLEQIRPTLQQQRLIGHYCTFIAQAGLWRLALLLKPRAEMELQGDGRGSGVFAGQEQVDGTAPRCA
jgi:hypothetical protein